MGFIEVQIWFIFDDSFVFCPAPFRRKVEGHSFRHSVLPSVFPSFCLSVSLKYYVPCVRNSSYSFMPIPSKLYRCFCHGLKLCMWSGYYPEIIFCHFFRNFNLSQICMAKNTCVYIYTRANNTHRFKLTLE